MTLQYNVGLPGTPPPAEVGTIQVGRDASGNFALSPAGLAVRRADGTYTSLDAERDLLVDVSPLVLVGVDPCVIRLPVPAGTVRRGDLIIASDAPFSPLFVLGRELNRVLALDPLAGEVVTYAPPSSLFFDVYVVAASLYDLFAGDDA